MKVASLKTEGRDGRLVVTSRDLSRCVAVPDIAPSLQAALDDWGGAAPRLAAVYERLNEGAAADARSRSRGARVREPSSLSSTIQGAKPSLT